MDETKVIHPDHEDPRWCESLEGALGLPSTDTADTMLCPVTWPGALEHPTTRVHACERISGHGERPCPEHDQSPDPTHGRIDRDIQAAVDEIRPTSLGQRVAIENTFQAQRDARRPANPAVPSTGAPAAAGPHPDTPDHIIADTDQVEAHILAEFEASLLRDLALDLLHDLAKTRAEVRRLRVQVPNPQRELAPEADAPTDPAAGLGPGILGRALIDCDGELWRHRPDRDEWRHGSGDRCSRAEVEEYLSPVTEVLLVSPAAGRVLAAARWCRDADNDGLNDDFDAAARELRAAVDALDGDGEADNPDQDGALARFGIDPAELDALDGDQWDSEPLPEWGVSTAEAEANVPAMAAAVRASALDAEPDPEPDSGPGWRRADIQGFLTNIGGAPPADDRDCWAPEMAEQIRALLADRDRFAAAVDAYRQGYGGLRDRASTLVRERDTARAELAEVTAAASRRWWTSRNGSWMR